MKAILGRQGSLKCMCGGLESRISIPLSRRVMSVSSSHSCSGSPSFLGMACQIIGQIVFALHRSSSRENVLCVDLHSQPIEAVLTLY